MDKVSSRYAEAILEIAGMTYSYAAYKQQAKVISKVFKDNPEFGALFQKTQISNDEKKALIQSVFDKKIDPMMINLMCLLIDKHRMTLVAEIMDDLVHMANKKLAIEEGIVYSIRPLPDSDIKALEKQLSLKHNVSVELINKIDMSLISGLKIKFKESVIDASLSAKLEGLRETLREGRS
jgi:F-type H+-transporting ATPase subunit delta